MAKILCVLYDDPVLVQRGTGSPLKLQLVAKEDQVGWSHSPLGALDSGLRRYTARPRGSVYSKG